MSIIVFPTCFSEELRLRVFGSASEFKVRFNLTDPILLDALLPANVGGSAACHKGNTSYKINASCIGGTVHTFKNEKTDAEKKEWYFKADNNNINSGYYPQINSKEEIISSKINGYSYITGNIDTISYDNTNYLIDLV